MLKYNINKITPTIIKNPNDIIEVVENEETKSFILPSIYLPLIENMLKQNREELEEFMEKGRESINNYLGEYK